MKQAEYQNKKIIKIESQTCCNCLYFVKEKCEKKIYNANEIKRFGCNLFKRKR